MDLFPGGLSTDGLEYDKLGGMNSKEIDAERLNGGREDEESDSSAKEIQEDGKKENISLKRIKKAINVSHRTTELEIEKEEFPSAIIAPSSKRQMSTEELINKEDQQQQQPDWSLRYEQGEEDANNPVSTRDLIFWAFQIARGMDYLDSKKVVENFINHFSLI